MPFERDVWWVGFVVVNLQFNAIQRGVDGPRCCGAFPLAKKRVASLEADEYLEYDVIVRLFRTYVYVHSVRTRVPYTYHATRMHVYVVYLAS